MIASGHLIDAWMPEYDVSARYRIPVRAPPARTYEAVQNVDISRSRSTAWLFRLRELPGSLRRRGRRQRLGMTIPHLLDFGFIHLAETPGEEMLLGLAGRFWTPSGGVIRLTAEEFAAFGRPGFALATWNFALRETARGNTILSTETRVLCTDPNSRRWFRVYWTLVGPFSGLIRREALRLIKQSAESTS